MPAIAPAISGKTYQFPDNALNVKSLSLSLTDVHPHYDLEIYTRDPALPSLRLAGPIGLDGLYRQGEVDPARDARAQGGMVRTARPSPSTCACSAATATENGFCRLTAAGSICAARPRTAARFRSTGR